MSSELTIDNKEVFKLDKEVLSFKLDIDNLSEQEPIKSSLESKNEIKITNLTEDYLAFRIKTTKKLYYCVQPTYCIIPPKEIKSVMITFYLKEGEIPKLNGHKFKFEGFIILESEKDKDAKDLFNEYTQKGTPVTGNSHKTFVHFSNNNNDQNENSSDNKHENNFLKVPNSNISHVRSGSDLSEYLDTEEKNEIKDENEKSENKGLLIEQIQSNEEKRTTLSDIISTGKNDIIQEEKKEEEIKNVIEEIKEKKDDIINNNVTIGEKINSEETPNKTDNLDKIKKLVEQTEKNYFEEKNNIIKNNVFDNDVINTSDILTFVALFIAMILGYYLVK